MPAILTGSLASSAKRKSSPHSTIPNIAAIHGLQDSDSVRSLVLEFVDGPTLADLIGERPMPLDNVLAIARQIADALDAAHEKGVIHRDSKPANIKVTPDGKV